MLKFWKIHPSLTPSFTDNWQIMHAYPLNKTCKKKKALKIIDIYKFVYYQIIQGKFLVKKTI